MKSLIQGLGIALVALCASLSVFSLLSPTDPAYACPDTNTCDLLGPDEVEQNTLNEFDYTVTAKWWTKGTPFLGAVSLVENASDHIEGELDISPDYIFPTTCEEDDGEDFFVDGVTDGSQAIVTLLLQLGPSPNDCSDNKTTLVTLP